MKRFHSLHQIREMIFNVQIYIPFSRQIRVKPSTKFISLTSPRSVQFTKTFLQLNKIR
ncbi:protein of unknown function [Burkholderia multivorans]